jgi:hypothetical protein
MLLLAFPQISLIRVPQPVFRLWTAAWVSGNGEKGFATPLLGAEAIELAGEMNPFSVSDTKGTFPKKPDNPIQVFRSFLNPAFLSSPHTILTTFLFTLRYSVCLLQGLR